MGQGITRKLMNWLGHLTGNLCSHRRVWLCTRRQLSGTQMTSWSQSGLWRHPTAQEVSRCWEPGSGQMHRPQEPQGQTAAAHPSRNLWDWTRCVFQQVPDRLTPRPAALVWRTGTRGKVSRLYQYIKGENFLSLSDTVSVRSRGREGRRPWQDTCKVKRDVNWKRGASI